MIDKVIGIFLAIVSLAAIAVIVSNRSNTANVLNALLVGFQGSIAAAVSPVTG